MLRSRGGCGRHHPGLHRRGDEPGARPERGDLRLGGELPQPLGIGLTVVEHDRGARQEPADQEVPHHPAGGGEPEETVAGTKIAVQPRLLQVLQQDAALPLDDRLRQTRRAGRVEDPERVVEGQALEAQLGGLGEQLLPSARHQHRVLDRRDRGDDLGHALAAIEVAPAVAVALGGDQDLWLDLLEAIDHCGGSELGRAARPDGADARAGQERHHRLGHVRHVRRHPVAALHPEPAQPGGAARHLIRELVPAQLAQRLGLRRVHDRRLPRPRPSEQVLGVVQLGAREPLGSRHLAATQHALVGRVDLEPVPERAPEAVEVLHRPSPQLVVVGEPARPHEAGHLGRVRVRRGPQKLSLRHGGVILGALRARGRGGARRRRADRAARGRSVESRP